jgi:hypothetical protein
MSQVHESGMSSVVVPWHPKSQPWKLSCTVRNFVSVGCLQGSAEHHQRANNRSDKVWEKRSALENVGSVSTKCLIVLLTQHERRVTNDAQP